MFSTTAILGAIAFAISSMVPGGSLKKLLVFMPLAVVAVVVGTGIEVSKERPIRQPGFDQTSSDFDRMIEELGRIEQQFPDSSGTFADLQTFPEYDFENWAKSTSVGSNRIEYWDYYGCVTHNFPHINDPDYVVIAAQNAQIFAESMGMSISTDDIGTINAGFRMAAFFSSILCKYNWDFDKVDQLNERLAEVRLDHMGIPSDTRIVRSQMFDQMSQAGLDKAIDLITLQEKVFFLRFVNICKDDFDQKGCQRLKNNLTASGVLARYVEIVGEFDFSTTLTKPGSGPRLRLSREPEIYIYTDISNGYTAGSLSQNAAAMLGTTPKLDSNLVAQNDPILTGFLAEIDNHWPPITTDVLEDVFRFHLILTILVELENAKTLMPEDEGNRLKSQDMHIVFSDRIERGSCNSGASGDHLPGHRGFYCPNLGYIQIDVSEPGKQSSFEELFGLDFAVLSHELSHYFYSRFQLDENPFINEGVATAFGENSLRVTQAGLANVGNEELVADAISTFRKLFEAEQVDDQPALDTATVMNLIDKAPLTRTQKQLACVVKEYGVTGADIERHLKQDLAAFHKQGNVGYARAWAIFSLIAHENREDETALLAEIDDMFELARKLNSSIDSGEIGDARDKLSLLAADAGEHVRFLTNGREECW